MLIAIRSLVLLAAGAAAVFSQTSAIQSATELQGRNQTLAPGDPVIIRGTALTRGLSGAGQPSTLTVTAGGKAMAIRSYSPTVIEAVLPYDVSSGTQPLVIASGGTTITQGSIRIAALAPNLLTNDWSMAGPGMIIRPFAPPTVLETGATLVQYVRATAQAPALPGEFLFVQATGLGVTNPVIESLKFPERPAPIAVPVKLEAGGRQMEGVSAFVDAERTQPFFREVNNFGSVLGWSRIYFKVPSDMPEGTHTLRITAGNEVGNSVQLFVGKPLPLIQSLITAPGRWAALSPGTLFTLFGINFGGKTATGGFTSLKAGEVSVEIDGRGLPVLGVYEPPGQINAVAPMDLPAGRRVVLTVRTAQGVTNYPTYTFPVLPSLFKLGDPTNAQRAYAIATHVNTAWLTVPGTVADALKLPVNCAATEVNPASSCGEPIKPGGILQIYATGLGKATADGTETGAPLPNSTIAPLDGSVVYKTVAPVTVTIGGVSAEVLFSGLTPGLAGLYQLNVRVPVAVRPGDAVALEISQRLGNNTVSDTALIAVAAP